MFADAKRAHFNTLSSTKWIGSPETKRNSQARSDPDLRYMVFQREKAPETGKEHYQGYFEYTQPKWFTTIKKCLSKETIGVDAHIEQRKGKRSQAREY